MVEVAQAAKNVRDSQLRMFFLRVKAKKGFKIAIVALARKVLSIIHHLLINGEEYVEGLFKKRLKLRFPSVPEQSLEEMADILRGAGYLVRGPP